MWSFRSTTVVLLWSGGMIFSRRNARATPFTVWTFLLTGWIGRRSQRRTPYAGINPVSVKREQDSDGR